MNSLWTLGFFLISFSIVHPLTTLIVHQSPWIKKEITNLKKTKNLALHYPRLLLQWSSFLKAGYSTDASLKLLASHPTGNHFYTLLTTHKPLLFPPLLKMNLEFLKSAVTLSKRQGTPLSPLLDSLSHLFQEQATLAQKIKLITYPARTQAWVALILPWFVLGIFSTLHRGFIQETLQDPLGWIGLATAIGLEGLAYLWIRRILK